MHLPDWLLRLLQLDVLPQPAVHAVHELRARGDAVVVKDLVVQGNLNKQAFMGENTCKLLISQ